MAEPHVVAALRDKRAELSGAIVDLEKSIGQHRADLLHVDAVLRLFAPEFEPATIPPRAVRRPNSWLKPGELARLVLDVLRTAPAALTVREITGQVMERHGLDPQDTRTGPSRDWGSSRHGHLGDGIDFGFEQLAEAGTEFTVAQRTWGGRSAPRRDHRTCCDLFIRRLTRKLAVPSVSDVPTRRPARWRSASLTSQALWL